MTSRCWRVWAVYVTLGVVTLGIGGCTEGPSEQGLVAPDTGDHDGPDPSLSNASFAVDTPLIECLSPESYTTVVLAAGQVTTTVSVNWSTNAAADIAAGTFGVSAYDNGVSVALKSEVAAFDVPLSYGEHVVTLAMTSNGTPMTHEGAHCDVVIRVTRACIASVDCADDYFCNSTSCEAAGGGIKLCAFGPPPVADCCVSNFDCPTGSLCDVDTHTCGECGLDADCDDGNACTQDVCEGGTCISVVQDPECCDCAALETVPASEQCQGGGFCGTPSCNCDTNTCEYTPKDVGGQCCETGEHASCDDGDPCTEDTCVGNSCRHTPVLDGASDCCDSDAECNDGNPCTSESCDQASNTCVSQPQLGDGCCATDQDCDDGDPLTWDSCIVWQCVHTGDFGYCEIDGASDVVINELMINPAQVNDSSGEWIELYNNTDGPIDISGWRLTELGQTPQEVFITTDEPLIIEPFSTVVLCRSSAIAENGGIQCDYEYGGEYTLSNSEDEVILLDQNGDVADEVYYDGGLNFPDTNTAGASMALISPDHDNNIGPSWRLSLAVIAGSTDRGTPGAGNADVFAVLELTQCHETPDDNPCTLDTCIDNACAHIQVESCCNVDSDCMPPTACHSATCVDHQCQFAAIPAPTCCLDDAGCDDGSPCSVDKCVANQCKYGEALDASVTGCCDGDADCPGAGNPCLVAACDLSSNTCEPATVATGVGCCATNSYPSPSDPAECDDGDPSTIDSCKDFQCFSYPDATWCDSEPGGAGTNHCHLDGNPCTDSACDVASNSCLYNPVPGCCTADSDCFDGNPCTRDSCDSDTGQCVFPTIYNCCFKSNEAAECDDGNACTEDLCVGLQALEGTPGESWGRCRRTRNSSTCCNTSADCDDNNACTADACDPVTNLCTHEPVELPGGATCCDAAAGPIAAQCGDGNGCTVESCVNHECVHTAVKPLFGSVCCDSGASDLLGDEGVQCDDGNACTNDVCVYGWCRHLPTTGMDCCATDGDCNDGNSCTVDSCVEVNGTKLCSNALLDCDDDQFCNGAETCDSGVGCTTIPGSVPALDDGVACTVDVCDEGSDTITHSPNNAFCDNGVFCDGAETCSAVLGCQSGEPLTGDDGIPCTTDGCTEATKSFFHTPNDAVCDDGKLCNGEETCDVIAGCVPGVGAVDVDDGIACTIDSCDDATQQPKHLPDNSLCNDTLLCTADVCSPTEGCTNTLLDNVCLIGGVCYAAGATQPGQDCQVCNPAVSTTTWSPKVSTPETCNGLDDDCDGVTDEDGSNLPLNQPCTNACGEAGIETCQSGVYTGCTAPVLVEVCGDGQDNDCDGETDGTFCGDAKPPVVGAELSFVSTHGEVENLVLDNGDGTYSSSIRDLANPNVSGSVTVYAYGSAGPSSNFDVVAGPPVDIEVVTVRETLYADARDAHFRVQVRDLRARPVAAGTLVELTVSGQGLAEGVVVATCLTDQLGRCDILWTAPLSAFAAAGTIEAQVSAGGLPAAPQSLNVAADPGDLAMSGNQGGLQLPKSPMFTNDTFQVPVILSTAGGTVAAYDIDVTFNKFMLQVTALNPGSCGAFGPPVSNLGNGANTSGTLQFNAINSSVSDPCASGSSVHIATVTFKVLPGLTPDDPSVTASITGFIVDMTDPNFVELAKAQPMLVADGDGIDFEGAVRAWSPAVMGILASSPDAQLLNWKSVTGAADNVQLSVTAYRRDLTSSSVATSASTGYGNTSPSVAAVTQSGYVSSGTLPGNTTIPVTHQGAVSKTQIHNLVADPVELEFTDDVLQPIAGALTPGGSPIYQSARWLARVDFQDTTGVAWSQNVSSAFAGAGQVLVSNQLAYNSGTQVISGSMSGDHDVTLRDPLGNVVSTATLSVSTEPATCTGLQVVAPCQVELHPLSPEDVPVQLGSAALTASVWAYLNQHGQTCQAQVYAQFDDGARMRLTGQTGLSYSTVDPAVITTTSTGLMTAQGGGVTNLQAAWTIGGVELCTGSAQVKVNLPEAVGLRVTPETAAIALSPGDPASTIKGLPSTQAFSVFVDYADGSSQDITFDPTVTFDAVTVDPLDVIETIGIGVVQAAGNGFGTGGLKVTSSQFPGLSTSASIQVVSSTGLSAEVYEPYSPTLPRVADHTFSFIENSGIRQDGTFEAVITFSDGTFVDVTNEPALVIQPVSPGTQNPVNGIVNFDKASGRVTGQISGQVDIIFEMGSLATAIPGFVVESQKEGIVFLTPEVSTATLTGIIDQGTTQVKVWSVMNDGTRRRLYDSRFIPNLLSFGSSVSSAGTVNQNGTVTIRGNGSTIISVGLNPAYDNAPAFAPAAELGLDCNLAPDCGDVDLGDTVGLAFKDRAPNETFSFEARVNTCGQALGAFDFKLTYDSEVLEVDSVEAAGATEDVIFTSNPFFPGEIFVNAIFNPLAPPQSGANLTVFRVHYTATKGGDGVSEMAGTIESMLDLASDDIGPATPRPVVAAAGDLDPTCSMASEADLDGDCDVDMDDVRVAQRAVLTSEMTLRDVWRIALAR